MKPAAQRALQLILNLHPPAFRDHFAAEMLLDYHESNHRHAFLTLLADALRSLALQWLRVIRESLAMAPVQQTSPVFLSGQSALGVQPVLTPTELIRGFMLSLLLFSAFWYAEDPFRNVSLSRLLASVASSSPQAPTQAAPAPEPIVVEDVNVLDLQHGSILAHKTVVVQDGIIVGVLNAATPGQYPNATHVDGHGKFLMPGMWDMHTHITHTDVDFPLYIANGVLGIRSMGGVQDKVFAWNAQLKDGSLFGPLAFVSGPILDGPNGPVQPKSYGVFIANPAQATAEVDELQRRGADFVKVYDALSRPSYFAIAAESKKTGLPFAGHVPDDVTILEAVHAGQRSIEHGIEHRGESTAEEQLIERRKTNDYMAEAMKTQNFFLIPEGIAKDGKIWLDHFSQPRADALYRALAQGGTYLCPTLSAGLWTSETNQPAGPPDPRRKYIDPATLVYWQPSMNPISKYATPAYKQWVKVRFAMIRRQIPRQQALGVQLLTGTDLTVPNTYPGSSVHDEIRLLAASGLTRLQALQTATTHPVEFFGLEQSLGSIAAGKKAELVLLNGNPLLDLNSLDHIEAVITHKKLLRRDQLDQMMARAATVAQSNK